MPITRKLAKTWPSVLGRLVACFFPGSFVPGPSKDDRELAIGSIPNECILRLHPQSVCTDYAAVVVVLPYSGWYAKPGSGCWGWSGEERGERGRKLAWSTDSPAPRELSSGVWLG